MAGVFLKKRGVRARLQVGYSAGTARRPKETPCEPSFRLCNAETFKGRLSERRRRGRKPRLLNPRECEAFQSACLEKENDRAVKTWECPEPLGKGSS